VLLAGTAATLATLASNPEGLREAFHEAVEDYIETCAKIGKDPHKTYSGQVMFRVSPEVHRKAALAAELSGKSLNQWAEEVLDRAAD
jgi:predicted HicB family RNase H-like nuclease